MKSTRSLKDYFFYSCALLMITSSQPCTKNMDKMKAKKLNGNVIDFASNRKVVFFCFLLFFPMEDGARGKAKGFTRVLRSQRLRTMNVQNFI